MTSRPAIALLVCCLATGCRNGGGSGGTRPSEAADEVPTLVAATVVAAGPTPAAGDRLYLVLSEDAVLAPDATLDDADLTLSTGTLGTKTGLPALANPRTVVFTLGEGAALTPGLTTVTFGPGNDAVLDASGNLAAEGPPRLLSAGDGDAPQIAELTLNGIDAVLNGTGPAGGTLQVPPSGFTLDLRHHDATSPIDPQRTIVVASVVVSVDGEARAAGLDLADTLVRAGTAGQSAFTVTGRVLIPAGSVEFSVYVFDDTGMISDRAAFLTLVRQPTEALRPFETRVNPSQVWFLDPRRDVEAYLVDVHDPMSPVRVHPGDNGRPDLEELLLLLGVLSEVPLPDVADGRDSNQFVFGVFQAEVVQQLQELFEGVNVTFTWAEPGRWPGGAQLAYNGIGHSRIAVAGAEDPEGRSGTLGVAIFDPNNRHQEDDTLTHFAGGQRLGVFLHTIVNDGMGSYPTSQFRTTFDPFTPARGGFPIGNDVADDERLRLERIDGRTTAMVHAVTRLARFTAVILAHECGHSLGLVANGAMPVGLFGDRADAFPVFPPTAADGHIKMPGSLFPGLAQNVMSPTFDFDAALAPETRFNSLNLAYLRERIVVNGN